MEKDTRKHFLIKLENIWDMDCPGWEEDCKKLHDEFVDKAHAFRNYRELIREKNTFRKNAKKKMRDWREKMGKVNDTSVSNKYIRIIKRKKQYN